MDLDARRLWTLPRGLRALRYGVNYADTLFQGPAYVPRLEKYSRRSCSGIYVPGFDASRVAERIHASTYVYSRIHDLLLRINNCPPEYVDPTKEIHIDVPLPEGMAHRVTLMNVSSTVMGQQVKGFERLCVQAVTKVVLHRVASSYLFFTENATYSNPERTCTPVPMGRAGEFNILWGRHPAPPSIPSHVELDSDAEYRNASIASANRVLEHIARRTLASDAPNGDGCGGALPLLATGCRSSLKHLLDDFSGWIFKGPLYFVYDCVFPGAPLLYVLDAGRPPLEPLSDDTFFQKHKLERRLVFAYRGPREPPERPMFFRGVYA